MVTVWAGHVDLLVAKVHTALKAFLGTARASTLMQQIQRVDS